MSLLDPLHSDLDLDLFFNTAADDLLETDTQTRLQREHSYTASELFPALTSTNFVFSDELFADPFLDNSLSVRASDTTLDFSSLTTTATVAVVETRDPLLGSISDFVCNRKRPRTDSILPLTVQDCVRQDSSPDSGIFGECTSGGRDGFDHASIGEELRTQVAESLGYPLPRDGPLTNEEREHVRAARKKLRNRVSAKESRRKKAVYAESIEKRVRSQAEENTRLLKENATLKAQNVSLQQQLSQLLAHLNNLGLKLPGQLPVMSTKLMAFVIIISVSGFFLPTSSGTEEFVPGRSRSLLQDAYAGDLITNEANPYDVSIVTRPPWLIPPKTMPPSGIERMSTAQHKSPPTDWNDTTHPDINDL